MKFSKKTKVVALVGIMLVGAIFAFSFYKLQSSEIQKAIVYEIENKIPGSKVEIENFQYSIWTDLNVSFKNIKITSSEKIIMSSISEGKLEIPVWAVLFDRGTVKFKVKDAQFNLNEIAKIKIIEQLSHADKDSGTNKEQDKKKEIPRFLQQAKLVFAIENAQFNFEDENKSEIKVKIKKVELKNASLTEKFSYSLESDLSVKSKDIHLNPTFRLYGDLDLSKFINSEEVICNSKISLSNIEYQKFKLKDFIGSINLKMFGKKLEINLDSTWGKSSLNLKSAADIETKTVDVKSFLFLFYPEEILGINSNLKEKLIANGFKVKIKSVARYDKSVVSGNGEVLTEGELRFKNGENSFVDLPPMITSTSFKVSGKDLNVKIQTKFLNSIFNASVDADENSIKISQINSTMTYDDLFYMLPSEFSDLKKIQKKQSGYFELKGDGTIEKNAPVFNVELRNKGEFFVKRADESVLNLKNLILLMRPQGGKQSFELKNDLALNVTSQPSIYASSEVSGEFDLKKYMTKNELSGQLNVNGTTKKLIKGKAFDSSLVKLIAGVEDGKINVKDLNGAVNVKEVLTFIPLKNFKKIVGIDAGNAVANFKGKFQVEDKKILAPEFDFNLTSPVLVKMSSGNFKLLKIKTSIDSFDENMNIGFLGESSFDVEPKAIGKNVVTGIRFKGIFNGKEYVENKKINASLSASGTTKGSSFFADIKYSSENIIIDNINSILKVAELKALAPSSLAENLKMITPGDSNLLIKGKVRLSGDNLNIDSLTMATSSPFLFNHTSGVNGKVGISGLIKNNKYSMKVTTNAFNGVADTSFDGGGFRKLDDLTMEKLFPKDVKVAVSDMAIESLFIRKFLYGNETLPSGRSRGAIVVNAENVQSNDDMLRKIPPFNINLNVANLKIGKEAYFSKGDISFKNEEFSSNNLIFKLANGYASINFKAMLKDHESRRNVNAKIYNFNLSALNEVLPPILESVSGNFSGNLSGEMLLKNKILDSYHMDFDLNVANGELKKLNLTDYVKEVVEKIDITKQFASKLSLKISDQFEKLALKGSADNKKVILSKFDFVGIKNTSSITGSGEVAQLGTKGASRLDFIYKDLSGKISTFLKNNVGKEEVPLKLVGEEFGLRPDYTYTIKQVGGDAIKTQAEKALNKQAEKLGNKLGEKLGEKAGDLLNKLFKKK